MTKKIDEYGTFNMNKLLETIINITENSLSSTIYKLYLEKLKKLHKNNMDNIINKIGEKNITGFDANYKMVIEKCLKINVDKSILNTMQTHYFKVSEKNKSGKNIEDNIRKMKDEYDKEGGKEGLDKDTIENYRNIYIEKVSQKSIEGLLVLMKKLMCENFIFKDIIDHLEKSHRIKFYVDNIVKNFKKSIKAK